MKKIVLAVLFLVLFSAVTLANGEYVEVVGQASINRDLVQAREMAKNHAFRNAIEQGLGVLVDSQTITRNYELIEDEIYTQARGYVAEYEILDRWQEGNIFYVEMAAVVKEDVLADDLEALDLIIHRAGDPRVMVVIPEEHARRIFHRYTTQEISGPTAETKITQQLLEAGFRVVDQSQVDEVRETEEIRRAIEGEVDAELDLKAEFDADLLVTGEAVSTYIGSQSSFHSYRANLDVNVIHADTAEVVAANSVSATGADLSELSAAKDAFADAGDKMAEYLIEKIPEAIVDSERSVELTITDISFSDLQDLQEVLNQIHLVDYVYTRDFSSNSARIDVDTSLSPMELANELTASDEFTLEIYGVSGNRVELSK